MQLADQELDVLVAQSGRSKVPRGLWEIVQILDPRPHHIS
jgi:hypothetical protein